MFAVHVSDLVSEVVPVPCEVPLRNISTVAPVVSAVAVKDVDASVTFAVYSVTSSSNVGVKVSEPSVSALRFCVKKPPWYPNQLTLQL